MTSREKAVQLVQQMYLNGSTDSCEVYRENAAKRTALIAVDEVIKILPESEYLEDKLESVKNRQLIYWRQVKTEIENM